MGFLLSEELVDGEVIKEETGGAGG